MSLLNAHSKINPHCFYISKIIPGLMVSYKIAAKYGLKLQNWYVII